MKTRLFGLGFERRRSFFAIGFDIWLNPLRIGIGLLFWIVIFDFEKEWK